ncbi:MAG: GTPase HflX [Ignavibacteriales bacterium]|nr:GTPase HflX [Ignavibacteriales bacterium]MCB9258757.1 GTPase HflX [Ignavibacteriales bacterium]
MIETQIKTIDKAILVAVKTRDISSERIEEHLLELEMLADTAGAETIIKIIQDRQKYDPAYFIGKGKAEEIAELAELNEITIIIFDEDLNPTQVRNLERLINRKIIDRSGLILDIFASHAKTNQAKTQVELAQLQYLLPRLTRAWTHLSKQYGGIGTKGPGETQIETDRRIVRTRISKLKEKLDKIESQQKTKSIGRENYLKTTLVGYTNAGKSTLLNLLTQAAVLAENQLFATLDSTTRAYQLSQKKKILITDTVGFIRKLPHHLVASFKSTLNVVSDADLIIHVIDISNPFFEDHIKVVEETLESLNCKDKPTIKVFNKIDVLEDKSKIEYVKNHFSNSIIISAERGININSLNNIFIDFFEQNFVENKIRTDHSKAHLVAKVHSLTDDVKTSYDDFGITIEYKTNKQIHEQILRLFNGKKKIAD